MLRGWFRVSVVCASCWVASGSDAAAGIERCNGIDDDGDGQADEGPVAASVDDDGDGSGSDAGLVLYVDCGAVPPGRVADLADCDDGRDEVHPGASESCDAVDDDCDGALDDGACEGEVNSEDTSAWMVVDDDVDWWTAVDRCDAVGWHLATLDVFDEEEGLMDSAGPWGRSFWIGYTDQGQEGSWDWIDGSGGGYLTWDNNQPDDGGPYVSEDCGEIDPNGDWDDEVCDQRAPFVCEHRCDERWWFYDADGDGLGDPNQVDDECERLDGTVANSLDCDDGDTDAPGVWFVDADSDGFGGEPVVACVGDGLVELSGDCDDGEVSVHPGAGDLGGDGIDQDCDGADAEGPPDPGQDDSDGDGLSDDVEDALGTDPHYPDSDGDGWGDGDEVELGTDPLSTDSDDDGLVDPDEGTGDTDGDGLVDAADPDDDGDGLLTVDEGTADVDGDGIPNHLDRDSDGDDASDGAEGPILAYDAGGGDALPRPVPNSCGCGSGAAAGWVVVLFGAGIVRRRPGVRGTQPTSR